MSDTDIPNPSYGEDEESFAQAVIDAADAIQIVRSEDPGATVAAEIETLARYKVNLEDARRPERGASGAVIYAASQAFRQQEQKVSELLQNMLREAIRKIRADDA